MSCPCSIAVCYFKSSPTCGAELLILKHHIRDNLPTSVYQEESLQPFFC